MVFDEVGDPETVDRRFLASETAPETADLAVGRDLLGRELEEAGARVVVELVGFKTALGLTELVAVVGLRTAGAAGVPRFSASVSVFAEVPEEGARDVLLAPVDNGFFFSSPEPPIDVDVLCPVLEDVEAVALVVGLRTLETGGRVGGLLSPPVVLDEEAAGVLLADVEDPKGRFAATVGRFGPLLSFLTPLDPFAGDSFSVSVSTSEVSAPASSPERTSAGVSSWWGSSCAATSAILKTVNRRYGLGRKRFGFWEVGLERAVHRSMRPMLKHGLEGNATVASTGRAFKLVEDD